MCCSPPTLISQAFIPLCWANVSSHQPVVWLENSDGQMLIVITVVIKSQFKPFLPFDLAHKNLVWNTANRYAMRYENFAIRFLKMLPVYCGKSQEISRPIARTVITLLFDMQFNTEWLTNCIAVTDCNRWLYMYHAVFDVKNHRTKCVKFKTKIKRLEIWYAICYRKIWDSRKNGIESWHLVKQFKFIYWTIWDLKMRSDSEFAHHYWIMIP